MKKNDVEAGRSMLETLSVVAMIMVVTIASIAGFDYLIQYRNRQETVKTVNLLVTSIKSSDFTRRQQKVNSVLKADEVVKGPKVNEKGVLELPDSPNSYGVVRTLKQGGYMVALQINPMVCDEMFKSLAAQSAIVFPMFDKNGTRLTDPGAPMSSGDFENASKCAVEKLAGEESDAEGVKCPTATECKGSNTPDYCKGVDLKEYEKQVKEGEAKEALTDRYNAIMKACSGGNGSGESTASASEDTGVVSGYVLAGFGGPGVIGSGGGTGAGFILTGCDNPDAIQGTHDLAGASVRCCDPKDVCGDVCNCPPENQVTVSGQCVCAECDLDKEFHDVETCTNKYSLYQRHVCVPANIPYCGECSVDADCRIDGYDPYKDDGTAYKDHEKYDGFRKKNDEGVYEYNMFCVKGNVCRECNHGYTEGKSDDDTVVSDGAGNAYCPKDRPMCTAGACQPCDGTYDPKTGKCGCIDNETESNLDEGCNEETGLKLCMPTNQALRNRNGGWPKGEEPSGTTCKKCFDSYDSTGVTDGRSIEADDGCEKDKPLCQVSESQKDKKNKYGDFCHKCRRSTLKPDDFKAEMYDEGCSDAAGGRVCKAKYDEYGDEGCAFCVDDVGGAAVDTGCAGNTDGKLCWVTLYAGETILQGTGRTGTGCAKCFNNYPDATQKPENEEYDVGCPEDAPYCNAELNHYGKSCKKLPSCTLYVDENDEELSDADCQEKFGTTCAKVGCTGRKEIGDKLACVCSAAACQDDQSGATQDTGCDVIGDSDHKLCLPSDEEKLEQNGAGGIGSQCMLCFDDQPDTSDNADSGCGDKRFCFKTEGKYGDSCRLCKRGAKIGDEFKGKDPGCTTTTVNLPVCPATSGSYSDADKTSCVRCIDDADGEETDTGCADQTEEDTRKGIKKLLCVDEENPTPHDTIKTNKPGTVCKLCYNNVSDVVFRPGQYDIGCSTDRPYCDAPWHEYGDECKDEPPEATECTRYVVSSKGGFEEVLPADCQATVGKACTPENCPTMVFFAEGENTDIHACYCEGQTEPKPCDDGYYVAGTGEDPKELKLDGAECAALLAKDGIGCASNNPLFTKRQIMVNNTLKQYACVYSTNPNGCFFSDGQWIPKYNEWDDLKVTISQDTNVPRTCDCYDVVSTPEIADVCNHSLGGKGPCQGCNPSSGVCGDGWTTVTSRLLKYSVNTNFYCERYLYLEATEVDDAVDSSYPEGIVSLVDTTKLDVTAGGRAPKVTYKGKANLYPGIMNGWCNYVSSNHSSRAVRGEQQFFVKVRDYYLVGNGMNGYFYFPTKAYAEQALKEVNGQCYDIPAAGRHWKGDSAQDSKYGTGRQLKIAVSAAESGIQGAQVTNRIVWETTPNGGSKLTSCWLKSLEDKEEAVRKWGKEGDCDALPRTSKGYPQECFREDWACYW